MFHMEVLFCVVNLNSQIAPCWTFQHMIIFHWLGLKTTPPNQSVCDKTSAHAGHQLNNMQLDTTGAKQHRQQQ